MRIDSTKAKTYHAAVQEITRNYFEPILFQAEDYLFASIAGEDQTYELTVQRPVDTIDFQQATFSFDVSEPFLDISKPECTAYLTRAYVIEPRKVTGFICAHYYHGNSYFRQMVHKNSVPFRGKDVSVAEANMFRRLGSSIMTETTLAQDIMGIREATMGRTILSIESQQAEDE